MTNKVDAVTDPFIKRFAILKSDLGHLYYINSSLPASLHFAKTDEGTFNLETDEELFDGLEEKLVEFDKLMVEQSDIYRKRRELNEKLDQLGDQLISLNYDIDTIFSDNLIRKTKLVPKLKVMKKFVQNENKIHAILAKRHGFTAEGSKINISGEFLNPKEGDFDGSLMWRDRWNDFIVNDELAEDYIEKYYKKEIDLYKEEVTQLNNRLSRDNPIRFDFYYDSLADKKKAGIYIFIELILPLPDIDLKYYNEFVELIEKLNLNWSRLI